MGYVRKFFRRMYQHLNYIHKNWVSMKLNLIYEQNFDICFTLKPSNLPLVTLQSSKLASRTNDKPIRYPLPFTFKGSCDLFNKEDILKYNFGICSLAIYVINYLAWSNIVSKYFPPLNVQHIPSSVGKKEKYCMHGSARPNQLQSMTRSEQDGAVCFQNFVFFLSCTNLYHAWNSFSYPFQHLE
jgi:hypothetical protein